MTGSMFNDSCHHFLLSNEQSQMLMGGVNGLKYNVDKYHWYRRDWDLVQEGHQTETWMLYRRDVTADQSFANNNKKAIVDSTLHPSVQLTHGKYLFVFINSEQNLVVILAVMFVVFYHCLEIHTKCENTALSTKPEAYIALQHHQTSTEWWLQATCIKFEKVQCVVFELGEWTDKQKYSSQNYASLPTAM